MQTPLFGLVALSLLGCATDAAVGQLEEPISSQPVPTTSGSFRGHYIVPAPSAVAEAAKFTVDEVDWTVVAGVATLHYDLPVGLVGGDLSVTLSGPVAAGATTVQLTNATGMGTCTAAGSKITCSEDFGDLGALPISQAVVEQVAVQDSVATTSRVQVANIFSSDPIGTVDFDLTAPTDDDDDGGHGGGHGGGGGGHGPGGGGGSGPGGGGGGRGPH